MKGYTSTDVKKLEEKQVTESFEGLDCSKVKITKSLITLADVLRFSGEIDAKDTVLGSYGIGVISEPAENLFDLKKGTRVYISPTMPCGNCYNCMDNAPLKCSEALIAGEDYHGFLRDFANIPSNSLYFLPESVSDDEALFIEYISKSISIIDKLEIKKGDHVVVIGGNNFGNILCQLLIYYQAVPILVDSDEENLEIAKKSGIYYTLLKDENLVKEVSSMTGGAMAKSVVYITDCNILPRVAFSVAGYNTPIAFTGLCNIANAVTFTMAMKKQLKILCLNSGFGNTTASINLIANKAFNFSHLKLDTAKYEDVPNKFIEMAESIDVEEKIYETVVDLV